MIKRIFDILRPPPGWRLPVFVLLAIFCGLGLHVLHISRALSYLSDRPEACINCHIMIPQYAAWQRGSHGRATTCNDCHVPQDSVFRTYAFKAKDGLRHAFLFTLRLEPQVIHMKEAGVGAVMENCIRCHVAVVQKVAAGTGVEWGLGMRTDRLCWDCHRPTPHGTVGSLSSTPYARVPRPGPVLPEWLTSASGAEGE